MRFLIWFVCLACFAPCCRAFEVERARAVADEISADSYEGRHSGHPGAKKAEDYLAQLFETNGVRPGGRGGYFQNFPLLVTQETSAGLTLMDHELGKIPFVLGVDFTVLTHSGSGAFIAPVFIAGYGIDRPDKSRTDYGDTAVSGKIVVIIRGQPDSAYDFEEDTYRPSTLKWAKERGAAAILWYDREWPVDGAAIPESDYDPDMPLMYVGDRVLKLLLDGSGHTPRTYKEAIRKAPLPLETGKRLWINTQVRKLPVESARNVIGIVYGSDPVLKNEVIIVGAHLDHIGVNADDIIYNGADDNASGTAVVSELARSFAQNGQTLKRSVMFIHFGAEENGLLGSRYFVRNPTIPFGNAVCMLNFDMSGRGTGEVIMVGGELLGKPWRDYLETLDVSERERLYFYRSNGDFHGDYGPFIEAGCPAVAYWTKGRSPHYHHYEDDAVWLQNDVLEAVGTNGEDFIRFLADYPTSIACRSDSIKILSKIARTIDLRGFFVDAFGTVPRLSGITAAYLPHDGSVPAYELITRMAEVSFFGGEHDIETSGLRECVSADGKQRRGLFFTIPETALNAHNPQEVGILIRQGLSAVTLNPANTGGEAPAMSEPVQTAFDKGCFAFIPLDYSAAARVERWKGRAIVTAPLREFTELPESYRTGLLNSDALLLIEITETPDSDLLSSIHPGRARRVHLNLGQTQPEIREYETRSLIRALFTAGYTRREVLMLTGGNLRRFFEH